MFHTTFEQKSFHFSFRDCGFADPDFDSRQGKKNFFLFSQISRLVLGPTQPVIQWVPGFFLRIRRSGCETGHHLLMARIWMSGAIPPLHLYAFMAWAGETWATIQNTKRWKSMYHYLTLIMTSYFVCMFSCYTLER